MFSDVIKLSPTKQAEEAKVKEAVMKLADGEVIMYIYINIL